MAYVLGFFTADGNMVKNKRGGCFIEIEITDKVLLENIRKTLDSNHAITARKRKKEWKTAYRLQIGSKKIFNDLLALGLTPKKSKTIRLPHVPDNCFSHFVRGYFDGDGNVTVAGKANNDKRTPILTRFISGSKLFIEDLQNKLHKSLAINGYVSDKKGAWVLNYSTNESKKIFNFIYREEYNKGLLLERKKKIFDSFFKKC